MQVGFWRLGGAVICAALVLWGCGEPESDDKGAKEAQDTKAQEDDAEPPEEASVPSDAPAQIRVVHAMRSHDAVSVSVDGEPVEALETLKPWREGPGVYVTLTGGERLLEVWSKPVGDVEPEVLLSQKLRVRPGTEQLLVLVGAPPEAQKQKRRKLSAHLVRDDQGARQGVAARVVHGAPGVGPVDLMLGPRSKPVWFVNVSLGHGSAWRPLEAPAQRLEVLSGIDGSAAPLLLDEEVVWATEGSPTFLLTGHPDDRRHPLTLWQIAGAPPAKKEEP